MKRKHLLGNRIFMALVFVFLYAPIFILIIFSFNAGNSSAVWKGPLTFRGRQRRAPFSRARAAARSTAAFSPPMTSWPGQL